MQVIQTSLGEDDLMLILKGLREWKRLLLNDRGIYRDRALMVNRIELVEPDTNRVIGHFVLEDGWIGFEPVQRLGTFK